MHGGKERCPVSQRCVAVHLPGGEMDGGRGRPLMLQRVLFCPALTWCARAWIAGGVGRFFVVCEAPWREEAAACFPAGQAVDCAGEAEWPARRQELEAEGWQVEEVREPVMPRGRMMIAFHTPRELARLQAACHEDTIAYHLGRGVQILDPASTYIDPRVDIGAGTLLLPNTILRGETAVGADCEIGPNTVLDGCRVGDRTVVNQTQAKDSEIREDCEIGPYTHIRPHCVVGRGSKIGAFVQLKNCALGEGTKMAHLTYVGDADVGDHVNFGCGTVTSNYDGFQKHRTTIGDNVFIGCNTNLVPPVTVADGAYIAAGTTVTRDVPADSLAIGRVRQENKADWARRNRELRKK